MSEALPMSDLTISGDSSSAISSPASASGPTQLDLLGGLTTVRSGPGLVRAPRSQRPAKVNSALNVVANVICATLARPDISSASLAAVIAMPTRDTFGLNFHGLSASVALQSFLANRLRARTEGIGSTLYRLTYGSHDMALAPPIFALRASALRTSDSGSIGWPTPTTRDWKDGASAQANVPLNSLLGRVAWLAAWNTPRATDGSNGGPNQAGGALPADAALAGWPTPCVVEPNTTPEKVWARKQRLTAKTGVYRGNDCGLGSKVHFAGLPTPQARDGDPNGRTATPQTALKRFKQGKRNLDDGAQLAGWPTPMAGTPAQKGYNEAGNTDSSRRTQALVTDIEGPARLTASGEMQIGSTAEMESGGQLRAGHSRWLMGIPPEWDACAPTVTRSTRNRRRNSSAPISTSIDFGLDPSADLGTLGSVP